MMNEYKSSRGSPTYPSTYKNKQNIARLVHMREKMNYIQFPNLPQRLEMAARWEKRKLTLT